MPRHERTVEQDYKYAIEAIQGHMDQYRIMAGEYDKAAQAAKHADAQQFLELALKQRAGAAEWATISQALGNAMERDLNFESEVEKIRGRYT